MSITWRVGQGDKLQQLVLVALAIIAGSGKVETQACVAAVIVASDPASPVPGAVIPDEAQPQLIPEKPRAAEPAVPNVQQKLNDQQTLKALGAPDFDLLERLEKGDSQGVESRLALVRSGRLAALRKLLEAAEAMYGVGIRDVTIHDVLLVRADLAQVELEHSTTAASRLAAIQSLWAACIAGENDIRAKRNVGAVGGSDWHLYGIVAPRLRAEEQLLRELLAQRKADGVVEDTVPPKLSSELLKGDSAREALEALGDPDDTLFERLTQVPPKEIGARLTLVQSGRIAALLLRFRAIEKAYRVAARDVTALMVQAAESDLVEAEFEYQRDPAIRLELLRSMVAVTSLEESQIREADDAPRQVVHSAIAARLYAEERFIREVLKQGLAQGAGEGVGGARQSLEESLVETMTKQTADEVLESVRVPDGNLLDHWKGMTSKAVEARLVLVCAGRIWTLRRRLEAIVADGNESGRGSLGLTMQATAELAHTEAEYTKLSGSRIAAFKISMIAAGRLEDEVRAKRDAGAFGGNDRDFYKALAARLRAEELCLREMKTQP